MPKPRNPDRKKPPRVEIRREIAAVAEAHAAEQEKNLAEVVNDALRYYFAHAFTPPRWPVTVARDKGHDGG